VSATDYALADFDRATIAIGRLVERVGTREPRPVLVLDLATFVVVRDLVAVTSPLAVPPAEFTHNGVTIRRGERPR
jgi:hypothetical protein